MRLVHLLVAICLVLFASQPASADDSALNKEGFWRVGRSDSDNIGCFASPAAKSRSGSLLILRAEAGVLSFAVGAPGGLNGRSGEFSTEAYAFAFQPSYTRGGIMHGGEMSQKAIAALRLARSVAVRLDGREVAKVDVEGTGLDEVLDAVVACSQGKDG